MNLGFEEMKRVKALAFSKQEEGEKTPYCSLT